MISLSHLNKFKLLLVFFVALIFSSVFAEEEAIDIWQDKENQNEQNTQIDSEKNVGDKISRDETILEISTDKVDSEVPSPAAGTLIEILHNKNETVPVGEVIGITDERGSFQKIISIRVNDDLGSLINVFVITDQSDELD